MTRLSDLHTKWLKQPKYRKAYEDLEEEFALASAVIEVRHRAGLTQATLARKVGTTQPFIARLESGRSQPSIRTLKKLAAATGTRLRLGFEPIRSNGGSNVKSAVVPRKSTSTWMKRSRRTT